MRNARILLVDDDERVRAHLRAILSNEDDFLVVADIGRGNRAAAVAVEMKIDLAIVDINMPDTDGITVTQQLMALDSPPRVLILTAFDVNRNVFASLHAGASGFLLKDLQPGQLPTTIRAILRGETVLNDSATRAVVQRALKVGGQPEPASELVACLTEREIELVSAIGLGLSNAEIASRLFVTAASVKTYVSRVLYKLGLSNRTQLAILAHRAGLLESSSDQV